MQISIVGGGYVGLVTGACLADLGHKVTIIDLDNKKVQAINIKEPPIFEDGLHNLLRTHVGNTLHASIKYDSVIEADLILICVGTPQDNKGYADLSYISNACETIGKKLKDHEKFCVVAVKSTVPPGTTLNLVKPTIISESGRNDGSIGFGMNPEFLREGRAVNDFFHPDRIVFGVEENQTAKVFENLYTSLECPKIRTSLTEAEMIKYASNAFLATKISYSNEIGNLCKKLGLDVYRIMEAVGLDSRIGPNFLNAGAGFGGSCFPKDVLALIHLAENMGENPIILKSVIQVNDLQPSRMVNLLQMRTGSLAGKKITVLGLAFKDNTDDIRESRAIQVIKLLVNEGADVIAYDPMAMNHMINIFPEIKYAKSPGDALSGADGALIMTEWPIFSKLDKEFDMMASKIIIDGRHMVSGEGIEGVCW